MEKIIVKQDQIQTIVTGNTSQYSFVESGATKINVQSGAPNIVTIYSPSGITGNYVETDTFTGYTATTETRLTGIESDVNTISGDTSQLRTDLNSHTGDTSIHFTQAQITGFTTQTDFNTYTGDTETRLSGIESDVIENATGITANLNLIAIQQVEIDNNTTGITRNYNLITGNTAAIDNMADIYNLNGFDLIEPDTLGTLSWDDSTRTFSIAVASGKTNYSYYVNNEKYTKTSTESIQIPDVTGTYYAFFTGDTMSYMLYENLTAPVFYDYAIVGMVYWNKTSQKGRMGNERHGIRMDSRTHHYAHSTLGALYDEGLDIEGLVAGNTDYTQITSGIMWDEDIRHSLAVSLTSNSFMYLSGATGSEEWFTVTGGTKLGYKPAGNTYYVYNKFDGSNYTLAEGTSSTDYYIMHFFAIPTADAIDVIKVIGQDAYSNRGNARDAIESEVYNLKLAGLPSPEMLILYSVIIKRNGNLVALADGKLYVDFRKIKGTGSQNDSSSYAADVLISPLVNGYTGNTNVQEIIEAFAEDIIDLQDDKADKLATIVNISGATSIINSYNNKIIEVNGTFNITLPTGITSGFQCTVVNIGSGTITFVAGTGVTLRSKDSNTDLASQYGAVAIYYNSNNVTIIGDLE